MSGRLITILTPAGTATIERCDKCRGHGMGVKAWKGAYTEPIWGKCSACGGWGYTAVKWEQGRPEEMEVAQDG